MNSIAPATSVLDEVRTWPGVSTQPTPRGSTAIVFEGHELGHVHADRGTLDLPLSDDRRAQVLAAARAKEWFENWVTKRLRTTEMRRTGSRFSVRATTSGEQGEIGDTEGCRWSRGGDRTRRQRHHANADVGKT
jgi:hypothetical protein